MDNNEIQLVGGPCGQHGPYTFYKAFKYTKNSVKRIVTLSEFFFIKMWRDSDLLCIGELQLLWMDKNSEQRLASLRLYFLPENTPEGRMDHGEDEVLAISEKVVIRVEDLITWITVEAEWSWGRLAKHESELKPVQLEPEKFALPRKQTGINFSLSESTLDFSDVENERQQLESSTETNSNGPHVIILSFPKYCRYRAMMKRLEGVEDVYLKYKIVSALGGFYVIHPNTRVLFCRDTFDYPELEGHELLCNHLAPKLKGRPRGKRKKRSVSPGGSESNESESSITNHYTRSAERDRSNGATCESPVATRRSTRCHENNENKQFVKTLTVFMKSKRIPMGRVPSLGYKELNLHDFFSRVQKLGGYDAVTVNRLWKSIFEDMNGHQNSTSAATVIRRHYERFLLAYERHIKGEEYKLLSVSERRRLKCKRGSTYTSTSSVSDGESSNNSETTAPSSRHSPPVASDNKDSVNNAKTSSLRSIRVKPERQKDKQITEKPNLFRNNATSQDIRKTLETEPVTVKTEPTECANTKPSDCLSSSNNNPVEEHLVKQEEMVTIKTENSSENMSENAHLDTNTLKLKPAFLEVKTEPATTKESIIKIEVSQAEPFITDETKLSPDTTKSGNNSPTKQEPNPIPPTLEKEKDAEPLTSAVAPVAQKLSPEKSLSPVECKENVPGDAAVDSTTTPEIIEVPLKLPETAAVSTEDKLQQSIKSSHNTFIHDVKKIKLDILKEGGLEVTPVKPNLASPTAVKDFRPSVIQPTAQIIAKPMMPPPAISSVPMKRTHMTYPIVTSRGEPVTPTKNSARANGDYFTNGSTPPKVVQSKSIYSYSEKMVYGNPKDILQPSTGSSLAKMYAQTPRFHGMDAPRATGGDPVDLSVASPQKPVVEIMRVPQTSSSASHSPFNRDTVAKNLYSESVTKHPYSDSVAKHPYSDSVAKNLYSDSAAKHPYSDSVTKNFYSDSVAKHAYSDSVAKNLYSDSAAKHHYSDSVAKNFYSDSATKHLYKSAANAAASSLLDGRRLGSNLEITLVRPKNQQEVAKRTSCGFPERTASQKRPAMESNYGSKATKTKIDENGRYSSSKHIPSPHYKSTSSELNVPNVHHLFGNNTSSKSNSSSSSSTKTNHHHHHKNDSSKQSSSSSSSLPQLPKAFSTAVPPALPNYMAQFHENSANGLSPFMHLNSLYYQTAMQNLYSNNLNSVPRPLLPISSPEQLKFYAELMAQAQGRLNFPFQMPQDGEEIQSRKTTNSLDQTAKHEDFSKQVRKVCLFWKRHFADLADNKFATAVVRSVETAKTLEFHPQWYTYCGPETEVQNPRGTSTNNSGR